MSSTQMTFETVSEALPGPKWQQLFARYKPAYLAWFSSRTRADAPDLATCEAALARHMPELMPTYRRLVALAGGGEAIARLLTCYRPPAYLVSCSQAAVAGPDGAVLIRNYDLDPALNEGLILDTAWTGRQVIGSSEFLWGLADGMNRDGLAVSLAFGGSRETGDGFGIPLIIRYLLETCDSVAAALATLARVPSHMAYNVTLADRHGATASVQLKPGGGMTVSDRAVATNHQGTTPVWPEHAAFTRSLERERALHDALDAPEPGACGLVSRFLSAPLYSTDYANGFGTLYTAVYRPGEGVAEWHWPGEVMRQSFDGFTEGSRTIALGAVRAEVPAAVPTVAAWRQALADAGTPPAPALEAWFRAAEASSTPDWAGLGRVFAGDWVC